MTRLQIGDRRYALQQFHFHHPSEHLVGGIRFAMEAHFVHAADDGLAVVGVLMVAGKPNEVFRKIVSTMPMEEGLAVPADPAIDLGRLLPAQRAYYHYEGSLTPPPQQLPATTSLLTMVDGEVIFEDPLWTSRP